MQSVRLDGCLFGDSDPRDYRIAPQDEPVPQRVDLRPKCTAVENQGAIGSCTANAVVGALEYLQCRQGMPKQDLSRMFSYFNSRRIRNEVMADRGATIAQAMASVLSFGVCLESLWPYNPALFAAEPSPDAYRDAQDREAVEYMRVQPGADIRRVLALGFPVVFGIVLPQKCYAAAERDGRIPHPETVQGNETQGGHAMLIVGYDLSDRQYIVRNSWGEGWGDRGYCYIPFDLMDDSGRAREFWTIRRLEQQGEFQVIRPGRAAATEAARCPSCGAEAAAGARFCAQCGAPLGATGAEQQTVAEKLEQTQRQMRDRLDAQLNASRASIDAQLAKIRKSDKP